MSDEQEVIDVQEDQSTMPAQQQGGNLPAPVFQGGHTERLEIAQTLVQHMASQCTSEKYVAVVDGKKFPKVEWWTTVGAALDLFPQEEQCRRINHANGSYAYEATVAVCNTSGRVFTRAGAICRSDESIKKRDGTTVQRWSDEYAVRSMAVTRATAKAYRVGLSFMAVMAQLEATPAEEVPHGGFQNNAGQQQQNTSAQQQSTQQQSGPANGGDGQTRIQQVRREVKTGTGQKGPWALHAIIDSAGNELRTFDSKKVDTAEQAMNSGSPVNLQWSENQYGKQLESIEIAAGAQQQQPGEQSGEPATSDPNEAQCVVESVETSQYTKSDQSTGTVYHIVTNIGRMGTFDDEIGQKAQQVADTGQLMVCEYVNEATSNGQQRMRMTYLGEAQAGQAGDDIPF